MSHAAIKRAIDTRRRQESAYQEMAALVSEDKRQSHVVNFEIASSQKIDRKLRQDETNKLKKHEQEILNDRRQRLARLYEEDMEVWKAEALSKVETQEDRKKRITAKAYALREARQKEREAFVADAYDRQWRDSCDDARALDSQALTQFMNSQRAVQIEEKIKLKQQLSVAENSFLIEWKRQAAQAEEQEIALEQARLSANDKNTRLLSEQVADNSKRREDTEQSRREEEMKMLAEVRRQIQADEDAMLRRQAEERARGREIRDDNMLHRHQLEQERVTQRRQDTILLEHALRVEKSQIAQEEAKKQVNRDAGADYKFYLEQQMIKEKEDCAVVDEMCKQEEERVWKQREDMLQAREDARKYLQRLVEEGRQQQIRDLAQKRLLEKMEGKEFAEKFIQSVKEGLAREREEQEELRQKNLGNRAMLQEQIDLRRQRDEIEKQQEFLQRKEAAYIEKLHQERLQSQAGAVRVHFPINSRQQW